MSKKNWEEIPVEMEGSPTQLLLTQVTIRGEQYAAAPVVVRIGGTNLSAIEPTFAVMFGGNAVMMPGRHINLRKHCVRWLAKNGMTAAEADLLLMLAEAVDVGREPKVPPLLVQESKGLYDEEVQKIADEIGAAIEAGHVKSRSAAIAETEVRCNGSLYAAHYETCLVALLWAGRAMGREFPEVKKCARQAMTVAARTVLRRTRAFLKLEN